MIGDNGKIMVSVEELESMGINYIERSDCLGMLQYNGKIEKVVTCKGKGQQFRRFKKPATPQLFAQ